MVSNTKSNIKCSSKSIGSYYEKLAADFFIKRNYKLVAKNFFTRFGELDLVLIKDMYNAEINTNELLLNYSYEKPYFYPELIFCEVRYRKNAKFGGAIASITANKQQKIIKSANIFISRYNLFNYDCRFDVLCIQPTGSKIKIEWLKSAFDVQL